MLRNKRKGLKHMSQYMLHNNEVTFVEPGDKVLLVVDAFAIDDAETYRAVLEERFPGVEFTFITGVQSITVQQVPRPREEPEEGKM